jgi:hypothetical protein
MDGVQNFAQIDGVIAESYHFFSAVAIRVAELVSELTRTFPEKRTQPGSNHIEKLTCSKLKHEHFSERGKDVCFDA